MHNIQESQQFRQLNFALTAISNGAKKLNISEKEMYDRLQAQGLVHRRLFKHYEELHTQSLEYVTDDIVETLLNWEAAKKEGEA